MLARVLRVLSVKSAGSGYNLTVFTAYPKIINESLYKDFTRPDHLSHIDLTPQSRLGSRESPGSDLSQS